MLWMIDCLIFGFCFQSRYHYRRQISLYCSLEKLYCDWHNNYFKPSQQIQVLNNLNGLKSALNFSFLSALIDASNWDNHQYGIFSGCDQSHIKLNHDVLAVCYDQQSNRQLQFLNYCQKNLDKLQK
ncbi:papain family cysteine protease, putative (macronuclear) [Tetrahymena thermophila SB210]|uniref:Papain family cysteine protease, putative n=1 Tax=Tetrahymena thermophila (strain SB210) TaxID=312017 RepID=Q23GZ5_TETTS|nr:papain family cysteine protease, putative [Tetrahymena thermophila SB210]EAR95852.2 papain family cysteine protease, putative [Tetrahymena thermophila SB210]|eukprot:XP_001016097.2 papain family cysteine protease, putative [Tetrahymena thermophila SB210]